MRKVYNQAITKQEADLLLSFDKKRKSLLNDQPEIVKKILSVISNDFIFDIKNESYWLIEQHAPGHAYHLDTGSENHMLWCQVGVSILLTDSFTGGETFYAEDKHGKNEEKINRSILDICVHTSDEWHMVKPHKGKRVVFLMFI